MVALINSWFGHTPLISTGIHSGGGIRYTQPIVLTISSLCAGDVV